MGKTTQLDQTMRVIERVRRSRPRTRLHLQAYVKGFLGLDIPGRRMCPGHDSPLDYLAWAVLQEDGPRRHKDTKEIIFEDKEHVRDCVVWANRGGGKTQLGAIATLLDMLFKPGIQIRILGGSFEQSSKNGRGSEATKDKKISSLNEKLKKKDEVLGEVMEEYVKLKKELGEP